MEVRDKIVTVDSSFVTALKLAEDSGVDKKHLMFLLDLVAAGKVSDFFTLEEINCEIIQTEVPQYESEQKHCRLQKP